MTVKPEVSPQEEPPVAADSLFTCPNHFGELRITTTTCAGMWARARREAKEGRHRLAPCVGCEIGAAHAGEPPSPPATIKRAWAAPRLPQALVDLEDAIKRGEHPGRDEPYPDTFAEVLDRLLHTSGMREVWARLLDAHDKRIERDRKAFEAAGGPRDEVESLSRHPDFSVIAVNAFHGDFVTATRVPKMPTRREEAGIYTAIDIDARRLADQIERAGPAFPDSVLQALRAIEARARLLAEISASGPPLLERSNRGGALQISLCRLLVQRTNDWLGSPHYGTVAQIVSALLKKTVSKQTVQTAVATTRAGGM